MRVYLSGPMTGIADWNFPAFFEAAAILRARGIECINPAENDGSTIEIAIYNANNHPCGTWHDYLRRDLADLLTCDAVVTLPGHMQSRGARLECLVASKLDMPIYKLSEVPDVPDEDH